MCLCHYGVMYVGRYVIMSLCRYVVMLLCMYTSIYGYRPVIMV